MLYSHLFEVAGFKIHYFAIPFALGLLALPRAIGNAGVGGSNEEAQHSRQA
jgi:hypothetical protein